MSERREVIVVGGGQAGLAIGYLLAQHGRDFTILEAADTPAAAWRDRWDWLHHDGHGPTHVRTWYPPFCVVADVVIAVPLLAGWM